MKKNVTLLVLDGLGVGAMPDVAEKRPQDAGTFTLRAVAQSGCPLRIDNLLRLGLGRVAPSLGWPVPAFPLASYGRSRLAHQGADSYLGHQEIMGTIPKTPVATLVSQTADMLRERLENRGYRVRRPLAEEPLLLVEEAVLVGDNLEADAGLNINLTVATDLIDFGLATEIGLLVREMVQVGRVIVFGGPGIDVNDILDHVERRGNGQIGVNSPALGVYDSNLHVRHLGYGVDPQRQAASILAGQEIPVLLLGKMADLIECPPAVRDPVVPTKRLMETLVEAYRGGEVGFIAATVQETDLSAHEGDIPKLAGVLEQADRGLGALLTAMRPGDTLIVCADHGNDPLVNVGLHTREETPLLVYRPGHPGSDLGTRNTLADIGATVTHLFGAPTTQDGLFFC